ncbi:MAG: hypothetical protein RLZZ118_1308, partial [Bacteroidota bacterium]
MKYFIKALKNYANFNGRANRSEYWYFALFNLIFVVIASVLDNVLGTADLGMGNGPIYLLYAIAVLIPGLAVFVRRMHDVNKSGWYLFIALIPLIGAIWLLVLLIKEGT